jgi:xanthine/CO dehydrogenase XdhC/CoxF family maturation factor
LKELADILRLDAQLRAAGVDAALASVVRVQGSSYRRPGARMLIGGDGRTTGGVSGGCLERDVMLRAGGVMESRRPLLVRYDTTLDVEGGGGGGYSLGCGGAIDVLIEPLRTPAGLQLTNWLEASQTIPHAVVTVVSKNHPSAALGSRMAVLESGQIDGEIANAEATRFIASEIQPALRADQSRLVHMPSAAGNVEVFVEILNPPLKLFVFGAGNDAVPLAGFARALGWRVTLVDVRSSPLDPGRHWDVDRHIRCAIGELVDRVIVDESSAAVAMTHNFAHDRRLIEWLASKNLRYLGLLGPRHRTDQLLGDFRVRDLRSPVGLDLGADNPEEVALAIVAEITAVLHGRSGLALSAHGGPIHGAENQSRGVSPRSFPSNADSGPARPGFAVQHVEASCPVAGS